MNIISRKLVGWIGLVFIGSLDLAVGPLLAQGTAITYQGMLTDQGVAANGLYDLQAGVYNDATNGTLVGNLVTNTAVSVSNGLFTAIVDFGPGVFTGQSLWLDLAVSTNGAGVFVEVLPRQPFTPTPYALFSTSAGNATSASTAQAIAAGGISVASLATLAAPLTGQVLGFNGTQLFWQDPLGGGWLLTGNVGTTPANSFLGTLDSQPLELRAGGTRALRLEPDPTSSGAPNVIGGSPANFVASSVVGATIAGGGAVLYSGATYSNSVTAAFGTIGGGVRNLAAGSESFVGGGYQNTAGGYIATVAGGAYNYAFGAEGFVGGGAYNVATNDQAFVGGGYQNTASGYIAAVVGGAYNVASASEAFVGGGAYNVATNTQAGVGSGYQNTAGGQQSFTGGGNQNSALGDFSFVGGGIGNIASGNDLVVDVEYFLGNPFFYYFSGSSTVAGGHANTASATGATIPGGAFNTAAGDCSLASGFHASALHNGSFVWADNSSSSTFADTGLNQFSIRATGGLRLTSPWGVGLDASDNPLITRGWDQFASTAGNKAGHGRWGLFMESTALVNGIAGPDVGYRQFEVSGYNTDGTRHAYLTVGNNGITTVRTLAIAGGSDLAEPFPMGEKEIEKGSVMVIDPEHPGELKPSTSAYDTRVAGVVSGANGIHPGIALHQEGALEGGQNVALTGRVYVLADAANGPIEPGDLLTTSDTPGHAMKVTNHSRAQGAILGKAMSRLSEGKGLLLTLVTLE